MKKPKEVRKSVKGWLVIGDEKFTGKGKLGTGGQFFNTKALAQYAMSLPPALPRRILPVTISFTLPKKKK